MPSKIRSPCVRAAGTVEQFAECIRMSGRQRWILLHRQRNDRIDILLIVAWIRNDLPRDQRDLAGGHVFIGGGDDILFLRLGERAFLQNLVIPQKIRVQRCPAVGRDVRDDAVVIIRISLSFLKRLLPAGRAADEIRKCWIFPVIILDQLLGRRRHQVRSAKTKILPNLWIAYARVWIGCCPHIRRDNRVSLRHGPDETAGIDAPRRSTIAKAKQFSVPFPGIGQPRFDVNVGPRRGVQNRLKYKSRRKVIERLRVRNLLRRRCPMLRDCDRSRYPV